MDDRTREQDADHRFAERAVAAFIANALGAVGLLAADALVSLPAGAVEKPAGESLPTLVLNS